MRHPLRLILSAASLLLAATCATPPKDTALAPQDQPRVLMIGLDGLRADLPGKAEAPNLQALAARGVQAEAMYPVMPSKTFVNFYSLATGLYPEHHGMVANAPYDRELDETFTNKTGPQDSRWWGGEPIWITAEKHGLKSAIMFWLGSEAEIEGMHASRWSPYEHEKPYQERVDEVLSWFDGDPADWPRFAAVYFDRVDTAAHYFGPDSPEAAEAVAEVDNYVGQLVEGLKARGLLDTTTIIVVADHGMSLATEDKVIDIGAMLDQDTLIIPQFSGKYGGSPQPFIQVYGDEAAIDTAYQQLKDYNPHIKVWKRGEMPDYYHFDHPTRGPDMFVLAEPGWNVRAVKFGSGGMFMKGVHGYDNHAPDMAATFIGAGPIFPKGEIAKPFENVNVYMMAACALGIPPAPTDGDPAVVAKITGNRCPAN
ncbi:hypothetical protein HY29_07470 [Hyphomonas beringensis]|uniref:Phosphodiesterase n=1 Tax=Hyphomonas beringensis TaxID=1280946 RepID=A0A062UK54_9PROT|nr:ectonucleotide pyrophosphatase/phosphodiesterase [Hyphomonas beringensis]KCZ56974.1 hypothetical protein HY29_07470 [Hyphomonas beringensis]